MPDVASTDRERLASVAREVINAKSANGNANGAGSGSLEEDRPGWRRRVMHAFEWFAGHATRGAGSPIAFALAVGVVLLWAVTGPMFDYSETWQLVINTATTIITFVMVFLIQQTQNKDSLAVHLKLNELLASHRHASSRLVSIEDLDEEDLKKLAAFYRQLSELAERESDIEETHGLDDALQTHVAKKEARHDLEEEVAAGLGSKERRGDGSRDGGTAGSRGSGSDEAV